MRRLLFWFWLAGGVLFVHVALLSEKGVESAYAPLHIALVLLLVASSEGALERGEWVRLIVFWGGGLALTAGLAADAPGCPSFLCWGGLEWSGLAAPLLGALLGSTVWSQWTSSQRRVVNRVEVAAAAAAREGGSGHENSL